MNKWLNYYPEVRQLWTDDDTETFSRIRHDYSIETVRDIVDKSIVTRELGGRAFRLFLHRPPQEDGSVIMIPGEFAASSMEPAQGRPSDAFIRALAVRELVNPASAVAIQLNDRPREHNLHFSRAELVKVYQGDGRPFVDRLQLVADEYDEVTMIGLSQGAAVASEYALAGGRLDAMAVLEAPNTLDRTRLELIKDFWGVGVSLQANKDLGGMPVQNKYEQAAGLIKYGLDILTPSSIATIGIMRKNSLGVALRAAHASGAGVVHAWAMKDPISGAENNRRIVRDSRDLKAYTTVEFQGEFADHSVTQVSPMIAMLTRQAQQHGNTAVQ